MKKIILLLFIILLSVFDKGYCNTYRIQAIGDTIVNPNQVSRNIQFSASAALATLLTMQITCLDQYITSGTNANNKIPIANLYLNDGINEYRMGYNNTVTMLTGILIGLGGYTINYNCIIKNIGVLPSGSYKTRLQFNANPEISATTSIFELSFEIPATLDISSVTNPVNITLTAVDVFNPSAVVNNDTSPQIVIKSNDKWKLSLNTYNLGELKGDYYFQITGNSTNVTNTINTQTKLMPNQQYILATGNPTVTTPITGSYVKDYINITYTLKNSSGKYLPEGIVSNYLDYALIPE